MADAMEVLLLSFLSPLVSGVMVLGAPPNLTAGLPAARQMGCTWNLNHYEEAALVTVVFIGMLWSAQRFGVFSASCLVSHLYHTRIVPCRNDDWLHPVGPGLRRLWSEGGVFLCGHIYVLGWSVQFGGAYIR